MLYGSEVWGWENIDMIEKFRLKCIKEILKLKRSMPSYMVYGETGRIPLDITIDTRMFSFWTRLIQLLNVMLQDHHIRGAEHEWRLKIESILNQTGFTHVWLNLNPNPKIDYTVQQTIMDQGHQKIHAKCQDSTKRKIFLSMKANWSIEHYITVLDEEQIIDLIRLRTI